MSTPVRFPNGLTTAVKGATLGMFGLPDPTEVHVFMEDFDCYVAGDWTATETGSTGSVALGDVDGGCVVVTTGSADNDNEFLQKVGESFKMAAGKSTWFKARFKVSDATQSDFVIGLQITDTSPLSVTDGIYFMKDDGDANLDFYVTKDSTSSSASAIATVASDTFLTVGFYFDGKSSVEYFVNDVKKGTLTPSTALPDDEELTISFGIQAGEAAAKVMTVDYVFAAKER
jgi:hypothetical protein